MIMMMMMMRLRCLSDVDECLTPANKCRHACKNLVGSFMCICPDGYQQIGTADECQGKSQARIRGHTTGTCSEFSQNCEKIYISVHIKWRQIVPFYALILNILTSSCPKFIIEPVFGGTTLDHSNWLSFTSS